MIAMLLLAGLLVTQGSLVETFHVIEEHGTILRSEQVNYKTRNRDDVPDYVDKLLSAGYTEIRVYAFEWPDHIMLPAMPGWVITGKKYSTETMAPTAGQGLTK